MKNKFLWMITFVVASFLSIGILNATNENKQAKKDGEILEILIVVNNNEIAAAKEAIKKASTPAVKEYAQMLETQHEQNLAQTMDVVKTTGIKPVPSALSTSMKKDGKKELKKLQSLSNQDFENTYIEAMVKGHIMVIGIMDTNLLKNVSNESLKNHLMATRPHLEDHLKQAQKIAKTQN